MSSSPQLINLFKKFCLLPPPFNDAGPTFASIISFTLINHWLGGKEGLEEKWAELLPSRQEAPLFLWVAVPVAIYNTIYWPTCIALKILDQTFPEFMIRFKIQPKERVATWSEIGQMMPRCLVNLMITLSAFMWTMYQISRLIHGGGDSSFLDKKTLEIPSIGHFIALFFIQSLLADVLFYINHRMLHTVPFLYKNVHSIHHRYSAPTFGFEISYMHPLEAVLTSYAVIGVIPLLLTRAPLIVLYFWTFAVTLYQVHDHSGFWLPFLPRALMHDYHHQHFTSCYGVLGIMDSLMGTAGGLHEHVTKMESRHRL